MPRAYHDEPKVLTLSESAAHKTFSGGCRRALAFRLGLAPDRPRPGTGAPAVRGPGKRRIMPVSQLQCHRLGPGYDSESETEAS